MVEVDNTPPSLLPLGLPPPNVISVEVATKERSSEYEEVDSSISTHTPKTRASFLKDKAVSLLRGVTAQSYLDLQQQEEEDLENGIVHVGTPEVASCYVSDDLLSPFKSGFQLVGFKGYYQATKDVSGHVRTLFESTLSPFSKLKTKIFANGQSDGDTSSSALFSMASLESKATSFLSGAIVQSYLDLQQKQQPYFEYGSLRVEKPVEGSSGSVPNVLLLSFKSVFQPVGFKGYDQAISFDSDSPSVCANELAAFKSGLIAGSSMHVQLPKSSRDEEGAGFTFSNDVAMFVKVKGIELASFAQKVAFTEEDDSNDCRGDTDVEVSS